MPIKDPIKAKQYSRTYYLKNTDKVKAKVRECKLANPAKYMWSQAKARAKEKGLEFNIEISDIEIPEFCPVFGIKLEIGGHGRGWKNDQSPTLDRIDNTKGYIKGNILVISWKANRLKSNSTQEERQILADFYNDDLYGMLGGSL